MILMKIMVIAAHPDLTNSRANRALIGALEQHRDIVVRDLYQEYPNWTIDIEREKQLLLEYDRIVLQFPFYWYSCPPLLKKWFDDVLTFGWAFGPGGDRLKGKEYIVATTTGGPSKGYRSGGDNRYTISELLRPIEQTLVKCNGTFLPAFVVYQVTNATDEYLTQEAKKYAEYIRTPVRELVH